MPNLYIIAGCNGAGKTTASYTVLPEMLEMAQASILNSNLNENFVYLNIRKNNG
jgi:predicted ABC-type ATPase